MAGADGRAPGADRGDIVLGWLVRLVAVLALLGVCAFDSLSIGASRLSIADQASDAARAAAERWEGTHDAQSAFDSAWNSATEANPTNEIPVTSFSIDSTGQARLTVGREAPTFLIRLVPPLRHWALVQADGVSRGPSS